MMAEKTESLTSELRAGLAHTKLPIQFNQGINKDLSNIVAKFSDEDDYSELREARKLPHNITFQELA